MGTNVQGLGLLRQVGQCLSQLQRTRMRLLEVRAIPETLFTGSEEAAQTARNDHQRKDLVPQKS